GPVFTVTGTPDIYCSEIVTCNWVTGWRNHGVEDLEFEIDEDVHMYLELYCDSGHDFYGEDVGYEWYYNDQLVWSGGYTVGVHTNWGVWCHRVRAMGQLYGPGTGYIEVYWEDQYMDTSDTYTVLGPILNYDPPSIDFGIHVQGWTGSDTFDIWNFGTETLEYTITEDIPWITNVNPDNGDSTGEHDPITVTVGNTGSMIGYYEGNIAISSNGGSGNVTVSITIEEPAPELFVHPTQMYYTVRRDNSKTQQILVKNTGRANSGL
ncbi:unnamed protein product, partial [marine sediment metagenome]